MVLSLYTLCTVMQYHKCSKFDGTGLFSFLLWSSYIVVVPSNNKSMALFLVKSLLY